MNPLLRTGLSAELAGVARPSHRDVPLLLFVAESCRHVWKGEPLFGKVSQY